VAARQGPWWFGMIATALLLAASWLMHHGARTYRYGLALGAATCAAVAVEFWRGRKK